LNDEYTYGSYGTYDAQGNVFGPEGRAYDPITGRAVASYASPSAAMSTIGGGYSKLRDAGEGVISSALGSYDNSVYKQMDLDPTLNIAGARAARMRGEGAPMGTVADLINMNTQIAAGDYTGLSDDDIDRVEGTPITATQLGFTGDRPAPSNISGKFGTQTGDIVALEGGQFGVRNESGTIETPTGTVVSISDSTRPGENISLLSNDPATQLRANQELSLRAGENDGQGSMSGFNVSDGQGGSYQTSSSGNTEADASGQFGTQGPMGMEDEYDEPVNTGGGNDSSSSGGGGCCFIMLEARYGNGTMDKVVRKYRDEHMTQKNRRGYYKVAEVLVPLMRKSKVFKWVITKTFADPLVSYGKWYYGENKHGWIFAPIKSMWLKLFDAVGTDTIFIRENGEEV